MKSLEEALRKYRKVHQLYSLKDMKPVEELKFRLFCITGKYEAEGYSDISSLENFLYGLQNGRTPIDLLYTMVSLDSIPLSELVEEAEINRLISKAYYTLLKLKK